MERSATVEAPVAGGIRVSADAERGHLLPAGATRVSVSFDVEQVLAAGVAFEGVSLPVDILDAVPRRRVEFLAGRVCAAEGLRRLDPLRPPTPVGRDERGAPIWPSGVVGSITHTDGYAAAVVARADETRSVGIDSERILSSQQVRRVSLHVSWPSELMHGRGAGLDRLEAVTLVFSAKEAIFKCLFPLTGAMFYYHDVRIEGIDGAARVFRARLVKTLSSDFPSGMFVEGRFELSDSLVHTGMWFSAR